MDKRILKAVSNEHRVRALKALDEGPQTYSDLMVRLQLDLGRDRGKFTYHLNLLRETGLIQRQDGLYGLTRSGRAVMETLASEQPIGQPPRFSTYFRDSNRVRRLVVLLLFGGVGLYLSAATIAFWSWTSGFENSFLVGLIALLLGLVCLSLILTSLPGGVTHRWERAALFVLVAGIYGWFLGALVMPPSPVLGITPAAILSFLGYRALNRGHPEAL